MFLARVEWLPVTPALTDGGPRALITSLLPLAVGVHSEEVGSVVRSRALAWAGISWCAISLLTLCAGLQ